MVAVVVAAEVVVVVVVVVEVPVLVEIFYIWRKKYSSGLAYGISAVLRYFFAEGHRVRVIQLPMGTQPKAFIA